MTNKGYVYWVGGVGDQNLWKYDPKTIQADTANQDEPYGGIPEIQQAVKEYLPQGRLATEEEVETLATTGQHIGIPSSGCARTKERSNMDYAGICASHSDAGLWVYSPDQLSSSQVKRLNDEMGGLFLIIGDIKREYMGEYIREDGYQNRVLFWIILLAVVLIIIYFMMKK